MGYFVLFCMLRQKLLSAKLQLLESWEYCQGQAVKISNVLCGVVFAKLQLVKCRHKSDVRCKQVAVNTTVWHRIV